ncbi:DGQHR domain-containing protein [Cyanobacteria bacterium FACHB-502]|nr:DGQHR domain-containing protein [Cyanobacteria bacterium FACHB-502]
MVLQLLAFKVTQPIGEFYVTVIPSCKLMRLAEADIRRITNRAVEEYTGIQRGLSPTRRKEIKRYVETVDATFPNSIILNLPEEKLIEPIRKQEDSDTYSIVVRDDSKTFEIIDGQHRLSGFDEYNCQNFSLLATIFIDLVLEDQAYIFSTINVTQTKINRSHVYDLFDVAETRSPEKTAHTIAKMLNTEQESPFYRRIKFLGNIPEVDGEILYKPILAQGTVVRRMLDLISRSSREDRDQIKRGRTIPEQGDEIEKGLIFRPFFIQNKDWAIYKTMINYFSAVKANFVQEWLDEDNPLSKTIGYGALMKLLVPVFQRGYKQGDISYEYFNNVFEKAYKQYRREDTQLSFKNFPASGAGENALYQKLRAWCGVESMG